MTRYRRHLSLAVAVIALASSALAQPPSAQPAFNVQAATTDDNGLPLNPRWTWQVTGAAPDVAETCQRPYDDEGNALDTPFRERQCTTQNPTFDLPRGIRAIVCSFGPQTPGSYLAVPGHVNWQPATFSGPLTWTGYNRGDRDLNFFIQPPNGAGVFPPSDAGFEIEFKRDEVSDRFEHGWWQTFRQKMETTGDPQVDHRPGVVLGLLGLDCDHRCGTELHPVYAMALNTAGNRWSLFARNWGNEGFCSSHDHPLFSTGNVLRVTIPWILGATAATVTSSAFFSQPPNLPAATAQVVTGYGIVVTFTLPPPANQGLIYGDLEIAWTGGAPPPNVITRAPAVPPRDTAPSVDQRIDRILQTAPAVRRSVDAAAVSARRAAAPAGVAPAQAPLPLTVSTESLRPLQPPVARAVENKAANDAADASFRALCAATNYNPDDPVLRVGCAAVRAEAARRPPAR